MYRELAVAVGILASAGVGAGEEERERERTGAPAAFTLGSVQMALRPGLAQAEVVERLGAPNILTRDARGRESWVYDRVSSDVEVASSGASIGGLGSGAGGSLAGVLGLSGGKRKEKTRSTQRTITVVVRFSEVGTVESFTWHHSRF